MSNGADQVGEKINRWEELEAQIISCKNCPRLVAWREQVARDRRRAYRDWDYWGKPVPGFGDSQAKILVVGLAPGAHGANRTGRMFTGDGSGDFLFRALHKAGFANQMETLHRGDGLQLSGIYISAVCRCAPPQNRPLPEEISNCLTFLQQEINLLPSLDGIVCLGRIAFDNTLNLLHLAGELVPRLEFAHGAFFSFGEGLPWLLASYHPSRQNTQTGRLTTQMFDEIWETVRGMSD